MTTGTIDPTALQPTFTPPSTPPSPFASAAPFVFPGGFAKHREERLQRPPTRVQTPDWQHTIRRTNGTPPLLSRPGESRLAQRRAVRVNPYPFQESNAHPHRAFQKHPMSDFVVDPTLFEGAQTAIPDLLPSPFQLAPTHLRTPARQSLNQPHPFQTVLTATYPSPHPLHLPTPGAYTGLPMGRMDQRSPPNYPLDIPPPPPHVLLSPYHHHHHPNVFDPSWLTTSRPAEPLPPFAFQEPKAQPSVFSYYPTIAFGSSRQSDVASEGSWSETNDDSFGGVYTSLSEGEDEISDSCDPPRPTLSSFRRRRSLGESMDGSGEEEETSLSPNGDDGSFIFQLAPTEEAEDEAQAIVTRSGGGRRKSTSKNARIPNPVPVPNLSKKSRGRHVPVDPNVVSERKGGMGKVFACTVEGCRKCFGRSEHLKRHIRSLHTDEKPFFCPHPTCPKSFSRHDNLNQHFKIHKADTPLPASDLNSLGIGGTSSVDRSTSPSAL